MKPFLKSSTIYRAILCAILTLVAVSLFASGCRGDNSSCGSRDKDARMEIIREASDTYLSSNRAPNISAEELYGMLYDDDVENDPFVLSVRSPEHYEMGHIPGAINIPWREVAREENLATLPTDKQIVVYCYTGHTASQVTALLNAMGYDAMNLKFGMMSWTTDDDIAIVRYEKDKDSHDYPLITDGEEVTEAASNGD